MPTGRERVAADFISSRHASDSHTIRLSNSIPQGFYHSAQSWSLPATTLGYSNIRAAYLDEYRRLLRKYEIPFDEQYVWD